jgi:phage-related minor tail protein
MHESLRKVIEQLEFEGKYLKLNNMDRQVTMQIDKMRMDIGDEINDKDEEALGILRKRIALNAQLNAEREIDQEIDRMHQEMELMTMGNEQRAIEVEYRRLINKYIEEGIDLTEKTKKKAHDAAVEMVHMKDATERLQNFAQSVGDAFGKAFEDAALHGKDFKSVMLGLIQDVEQALVHELITTQIVKAVSGAVSGSGFFQGMFGATPHADGTVLTSPTFFNGGRDVAGESGDEGVLPLTRTAGGKLGVHAVGANSKGDGNTTNVYMTVVTQDATSFNKSKRQIMGDLKSGMK